MEEKCYNNARYHQVCNAKLRRNVQTAKFVVFLIVSGNKRTKQSIQRQAHRSKAHHLDHVVEPVTSLVKRKVTLVAHDGEQTDQKGETIQLQSLH